MKGLFGFLNGLFRCRTKISVAPKTNNNKEDHVVVRDKNMEDMKRFYQELADMKGQSLEEYLMESIEVKNKWREYHVFKTEIMKDWPKAPGSDDVQVIRETIAKRKAIRDALWEKKCELFPGYRGMRDIYGEIDHDPYWIEPTQYSPKDVLKYIQK